MVKNSRASKTREESTSEVLREMLKTFRTSDSELTEIDARLTRMELKETEPDAETPY